RRLKTACGRGFVGRPPGARGPLAGSRARRKVWTKAGRGASRGPGGPPHKPVFPPSLSVLDASRRVHDREPFFRLPHAAGTVPALREYRVNDPVPRHRPPLSHHVARISDRRVRRLLAAPLGAPAPGAGAGAILSRELLVGAGRLGGWTAGRALPPPRAARSSALCGPRCERG